MTPRTKSMDSNEVAGRAAQAREFLRAAELFLGEARAANSVAGSNAVLAGIAAADAICGKVLGVCSKGDDHRQAVALLESAVGSVNAVRDLERLVSDKSLAGYSAQFLTDSKTRDLVRYAGRIVEAMESILRS
jgi:Tfp pilus assembly protein PilX